MCVKSLFIRGNGRHLSLCRGLVWFGFLENGICALAITRRTHRFIERFGQEALASIAAAYDCIH